MCRGILLSVSEVKREKHTERSTTMIAQSTPRKSMPKQAALARRLNACSVTPAQHVLDATVVFPETEKRNLIKRVAKYANLYFIRSDKFINRFYILTAKDNVVNCSCREENCMHLTKVILHEIEENVA